ncbi:hypothetical protein [Pedobacter frigiditerrae]|uniref:hypothetical protein n=1 Tax=Pedobacter frigiditerrae TaxID=2530452 RepID=UPI00292DCC57|nr:hypothetical protein [Pedobacter frigiditerrae]
MNLETATSLLPAFKSFKGTKSIDGYPIFKFLIVPTDLIKRREFLEVYNFNKWDEYGLIMDCYRNEDLTIIVQYDLPYPNIRYQTLRDFLSNKKFELDTLVK